MAFTRNVRNGDDFFWLTVHWFGDGFSLRVIQGPDAYTGKVNKEYLVAQSKRIKQGFDGYRSEVKNYLERDVACVRIEFDAEQRVLKLVKLNKCSGRRIIFFKVQLKGASGRENTELLFTQQYADKYKKMRKAYRHCKSRLRKFVTHKTQGDKELVMNCAKLLNEKKEYIQQLQDELNARSNQSSANDARRSEHPNTNTEERQPRELEVPRRYTDDFPGFDTANVKTEPQEPEEPDEGSDERSDEGSDEDSFDVNTEPAFQESEANRNKKLAVAGKWEQTTVPKPSTTGFNITNVRTEPEADFDLSRVKTESEDIDYDVDVTTAETNPDSPEPETSGSGNSDDAGSQSPMTFQFMTDFNITNVRTEPEAFEDDFDLSIVKTEPYNKNGEEDMLWGPTDPVSLPSTSTAGFNTTNTETHPYFDADRVKTEPDLSTPDEGENSLLTPFRWFTFPSTSADRLDMDADYDDNTRNTESEVSSLDSDECDEEEDSEENSEEERIKRQTRSAPRWGFRPLVCRGGFRPLVRYGGFRPVARSGGFQPMKDDESRREIVMRKTVASYRLVPFSSSDGRRTSNGRTKHPQENRRPEKRARERRRSDSDKSDDETVTKKRKRSDPDRH